MQRGFSLGSGLVIGGVVLGLIAIAWLLTTVIAGDLSAGGFVLGLFLLGLFVVPLIVVGLSIQQRGQVEAVETANFEQRRLLLDRDRVFRAMLNRRLTEADRRIQDGADSSRGSDLQVVLDRLRALTADLATQIDEMTWLSSVNVTRDDLRSIESYDDLIAHDVRDLIAATDGLSAPDQSRRTTTIKRLGDLTKSVRNRWDTRQDLLLRGKRPSFASPLDFLRGAETSTTAGRSRVDATSLQPGDAVSYAGDDYTVTARLSLFFDDQTWHGFKLQRGSIDRQLYVRPNGDMLMLESTDLGPPPDYQQLPEASASVTITSPDGSVSGVVVRMERWEGPGGSIHWHQIWPDGEQTLRGHRLITDEIQIWQRSSSSDVPAGG